MLLKPEQLAKSFEYEPGTGLLYRKSTGRPVGTIGSHGYLVVNVARQAELVHRVIWMITAGPIPKGLTIDHRNRIRTDNRWCNLRLATWTQQKGNYGLLKNNTSGRRGVSWSRGRWLAMGSVNNKSVYLGKFIAFQDAVEAREKWEAEHFGGFYAQ
jgi:HNH endonuclease